MKRERITKRVRSWKRRPARSPANGIFRVQKGARRCAMDYGDEIRLYLDRDPKWNDSEPFPHQYRKLIIFDSNQGH